MNQEKIGIEYAAITLAMHANPRKVGSHPHLYLITFTIISFNNALLEPISPSIPMY